MIYRSRSGASRAGLSYARELGGLPHLRLGVTTGHGEDVPLEQVGGEPKWRWELRYLSKIVADGWAETQRDADRCTANRLARVLRRISASKLRGN